MLVLAYSQDDGQMECPLGRQARSGQTDGVSLSGHAALLGVTAVHLCGSLCTILAALVRSWSALSAASYLGGLLLHMTSLPCVSAACPPPCLGCSKVDAASRKFAELEKREVQLGEREAAAEQAAAAAAQRTAELEEREAAAGVREASVAGAAGCLVARWESAGCVVCLGGG